MTLRDTTCTLADAKATAVSAITSAFTDPRPPVALAWNYNNAWRVSLSPLCRILICGAFTVKAGSSRAWEGQHQSMRQIKMSRNIKHVTYGTGNMWLTVRVYTEPCNAITKIVRDFSTYNINAKCYEIRTDMRMSTELKIVTKTCTFARKYLDKAVKNCVQ